ncbi:alkyl/aryl-sulfatase [Bradyrhizobium mercantei]|uniref:alkyl/aryl-sulfatase n=1 Tax=Bradyrhizobium mercantei TaxID=1904807 RepID=UPI000977DEE9|nr:alkyl sulfatase dimerization domain-containing protein [Bradyrhizobium mercantei]
MTNTDVGHARPKHASATVRSANEALLTRLPFADRADYDDAARGFIGTIENARIVSEKGRPVWSLEPYKFLNEPASPPTINPSLYRQAQLNMYHGLFEVVPNVYQIRGFDIANMTLVEGERGVIVVDCLTTIEGARAGLELYWKYRGKRPVTAVVITHPHGDHWGGVRGALSESDVKSGNIPIVVPDKYMEHLVSENIIAGPAMYRRAMYQFGHTLDRSQYGQVDCGLGKTIAWGSMAIVRPNDLIMATGDKRTIDGVEFEFQMAPGTEAPAEMHFYLPKYKVLNLAENCTHNFHNLLPFRGSEVRDPLAWSKYLAEALHLWGGRAEVLCGQHHWPIWGKDRVAKMIGQQRDLYKFAHDQTVRLMNHGLTPTEIVEALEMPRSLEGAWHTRGYYGHIRHNAKAIYQRYLGWYDANPANLDPLPRAEAGRKFVEYMGGADTAIDRAQLDFEKGEFRFVAQVLSQVVFAEPNNKRARDLLADTFEQLGYMSESANWRNAYLLGAQELRQGVASMPPRDRLPLETIAALRTEQLWDYLGARVIAPKAEDKMMVLNWEFSDTGETFILTLENCALTYLAGVQANTADATCTLTRGVLDTVIAKQTTFGEAIQAGTLKVEGDARKLDVLMSVLDTFTGVFEIIEPLRQEAAT